MTTRRSRIEWEARRRRSDASHKSVPARRKVAQKFINLVRRLTIIVARPLLKRYSHQPLPDLHAIRSVLIIPNDPVGDLLLTEPLWRKLKSENPRLRIGVAVSARNRPLPEVLPGIDRQYQLYGSSILRRWQEVRRARREGYDVVIAPVGFYKPTRVAFISRFIAKHGFTATMHHARARRYADLYSFCTERHWQPYPQPMVEQYQALIEEIFGVSFTASDRVPKLTLHAPLIEAAHQTVDALKQSGRYQVVVLCNLEAKVEAREWGMGNLARLAGELPEAIFLVTASPEYWQKYSWSSNIPSNVRRIETPSILDAAAVAQVVDVLLSPDTALVHFAAALDTPVVAFYPYPDEWLPYTANSIALYPVRGEPIATISVAEVHHALERSLHG